jgi:hypothetical protein
MGEVYRAKDTRLGRDVAIKVLPASFSQDPDRLHRFEQEARAAGILNHPNITAVYDIGTHEDAPYVVQELLEGETLRSALAGGRLPPRKAIDYAGQLARGLAAAHHKGIVHRDLKPENLFVTHDGRLKILDFGLAKLVSPVGSDPAAPSMSEAPTHVKTGAGVVMGTVGYMAPEQVRGLAADHRSDIFSFGCILYEMLSGRRAFHGNSAVDTMSAILKEDPPDLSVGNQSISPGLERIVRHCLEKNPEQRFHSAHDLAFDLENLADPSGVSGAGLRALPPSVRSRTWMWVLGSAVLAAALTALLLPARNQSTYEVTRLTFRLGVIRPGRFAPDGQTIVYSASWGGRPFELFAMAADGTNSRALGILGAALLSVSSRGDVAVLRGGEDPIEFTYTLAVVPLSGGAPRDLMENVRDADWGPDGREMAVVHRVRSVKDVLDYPIGTTIYESSMWLYSPRVSPDGERVAVFESSAAKSSLIAIDRKGRKQVFATGLRAGHPILAWSPDGREIWLSYFMGADPLVRTYAVDARGKVRPLFQDPSLTSLLDVSQDGRALFKRDIQRTLTRIKAPGEKFERDFSWLDRTQVTDLSVDGKTLVFGEDGEGVGNRPQTFMVDSSGGLPKNLGPGLPATLSTDGVWAFGTTSDIPKKGILFPTGVGQPRILQVPGLAAVLYGKVLPGGKQVLAVGREPEQTRKTYLIDLDTGQQRLVSNSWGTVSSDGTQFAFGDPDGNLCVQPVAAAGLSHVLGKLQDGETPIRWSLDGKSIYVAMNSTSAQDLLIDRWDVTTGKRTPWKRISLGTIVGAFGFQSVAIAPEADAYAYSYLLQQASDLFVVKGLR